MVLLGEAQPAVIIPDVCAPEHWMAVCEAKPWGAHNAGNFVIKCIAIDPKTGNRVVIFDRIGKLPLGA